jgi:hypothetical protein
MLRLLPTLVLLVALTLPLEAAEPPQPEELPPPRSTTPGPLPPPVMGQPFPVLPPSVLLPPPPGVYTRRSDYEVWQNLAVDRYGRFRPVVIMAPYGDYYRYNGKPFPFRILEPRAVMPYVVN